VTGLSKNSINKPLKNSLKRVVAKAAKFGDEIRREAGLKAGSNPAFSFFELLLIARPDRYRDCVFPDCAHNSSQPNPIAK